MAELEKPIFEEEALSALRSFSGDKGIKPLVQMVSQ